MALTGIIDIGSNSMRLSIIRHLDNGGFYVLDEQKSSPRLANELRPDGTLSDHGIAELISHLREFRGLCDAYGVENVIAIGTAALRAARNQEDIVRLVKTSLGISIDIVSGAEEAQLGYRAVAHTLSVQTAYLVDIGGGSTEISLVEDGQLVDSRSFPFGVVTMGRSYAAEPHLAASLRLTDEAEQMLRTESFLTKRPGVELIGIGGTIRNIARLQQTSVSYPLPLTHNYSITRADVEATVRRLASMPLSQRKKLDGLSKDRADLIVPGGAILTTVLRTVDAYALRVSGRGLRDGVFYTRVLDLPISRESDSVVIESVTSMLHRFSASVVHAQQATRLAFSIHTAIQEAGLLPPSTARTLYVAAMLHRIGVQVNYYHYDQHTFYLIISGSIYGLTHREVLLAALAASFKGKGRLRKLSSPYRSLLGDEDLEMAARLGVIVRLAETLDRRHEGRINAVFCKVNKERLELILPKGLDAEVELTATQSLAPLVKKIYGRDLTIVP